MMWSRKNGNGILMNTRKLKSSFLIIIFLLVSTFSVPADSVIETHGKKCVSLVMDYNFTAAHREADYLIKNFPKSPSGYFMKAAVFHYQMLDLGSQKYANDFYSACDRGVRLGESATGEWDKFFMAGILGIRGSYERSRNKLVTSLKLGWRAIEIFRPLNESGNIDALYGVSVYDYWVGANKKLLFWMDDVKDERPRALADLEKVRTSGIFTAEIVLYDLLEMYSNEKNYNKVKSIAKKILARHPGNTIALEFLFTAQMETQDYTGAKTSLSQRESALNARGAPKMRSDQLNKDWKEFTKKSGIPR